MSTANGRLSPPPQPENAAQHSAKRKRSNAGHEDANGDSPTMQANKSDAGEALKQGLIGDLLEILQRYVRAVSWYHVTGP